MSRKLNTVQINIHLLFIFIYVILGLCILNEIYFYNEKILDSTRFICIVMIFLCMLYIRLQKNVIEDVKESITRKTIQSITERSSQPPSIEPYEQDEISSTTKLIVFQNKTSLRYVMQSLCVINLFLLTLFILSTFVTMFTDGKRKYSLLVFQDLIPNRCCRQFRIKILSFFPLFGFIVAGVCLMINYPEVSNYLSFCLLSFPIVFTILYYVSKPQYDKFIRNCPVDVKYELQKIVNKHSIKMLTNTTTNSLV